MKIFIAIRTAFFRTLKLWKAAFVAGFLLLLLVSMLVIPIKGALNSGIGNSMITERLNNGIDIQVFADLGDVLKNLVSYFSSGILILIMVSFLLNVFLTGGLFHFLKATSGKFSVVEFFMASAKNFWSFLAILLIISIILSVLAFLVIIVPLSIVYQAEVPVEGVLFRTAIISASVYLFLHAIIMLVADYARAWQISVKRNECFKAIASGFRMTFRSFLSSFPLMVILLLAQVLYVYLALAIIPGLKPVSTGGVFLLFLLSQFMFLIKILLKVWRYGSVTALMEINNKKVS